MKKNSLQVLCTLLVHQNCIQQFLVLFSFCSTGASWFPVFEIETPIFPWRNAEIFPWRWGDLWKICCELTKWYCWWFRNAAITDHQLRLVVYRILGRFFTNLKMDFTVPRGYTMFFGYVFIPLMPMNYSKLSFLLLENDAPMIGWDVWVFPIPICTLPNEKTLRSTSTQRSDGRWTLLLLVWDSQFGRTNIFSKKFTVVCSY